MSQAPPQALGSGREELTSVFPSLVKCLYMAPFLENWGPCTPFSHLSGSHFSKDGDQEEEGWMRGEEKDKEKAGPLPTSLGQAQPSPCERRGATQTPPVPVGAELGVGTEQDMPHPGAEEKMQDRIPRCTAHTPPTQAEAPSPPLPSWGTFPLHGFSAQVIHSRLPGGSFRLQSTFFRGRSIPRKHLASVEINSPNK